MTSSEEKKINSIIELIKCFKKEEEIKEFFDTKLTY